MAAIRLRRVAGLEGRTNDVVLAPPTRRPAPAPEPAPPDTLIFFGGDVQDYPEVMAAHRDNRHYVKWNLESTARSLAARFPDKYTLVVRPSRIEFKSFSCYDNFVPSNNAGVPDHTPTHAALLHLERLLQGVWARLQALPADELVGAARGGEAPARSNGATTEPCASETDDNDVTAHPAATQPENECDSERDSDPLWWLSGPPLGAGRLSLAGFSKGCVVLNQLIYEFHYTKTLTPGDAHMMRFIERISEMYWLDGGHAGGKNTWITSRSLLETLTRLDVSVRVHVSPYQVCDGGRPWIGREEHAFTHLLAKLGAKVQRYLHDIPGAPHNLHMHFSVLDKFHSVQGSAPDDPTEASVIGSPTQASVIDGPTQASVIDGPTQASVIDGPTQASVIDGPTQASAPEGTKLLAPAITDSSSDET